MLDSLKTGLRAAIKKIVSADGINEELIKNLSYDVQRSLLKADVDVNIVIKVTKRITARALEEKPPPGLPRKDHIVKILYDEVTTMLGTDSEFTFKAGKLTKVLMLGIQGSGKTTSIAKLAMYFTKQGYKVAVIGADTHRPGALEQLRTMCEKSHVDVYGNERSKDPSAIIKEGFKHFEKETLDIMLIDTAGRHKEEIALLEEMRVIGKVVEPHLALLVIDGTIGNQCGVQAAAFHSAVGVGGIIITKLDSTAKGGGALAAATQTGAQVMYIGTGERVDDIELFSSTRFVGKLLGMGDIQAVLDMAKRLSEEADGDRIKRMTGGKMNMDDFYSQLEDMAKAGSMRTMIESMPGLAGSVKEGQLDNLEERMTKWRYIIQSMSVEEKNSPDIINLSRTKRIARGSGASDHDVKELLKNFKNSKGVMKASRGRQMQGMLRKMGLG